MPDPSLSFQSVLIANRGEIAVRIIRTCRTLGLQTVAVYSTADRNALHVRMADHAVHIGESPSDQSYLRGDKIIQAARESKAGAIHPGYGFLSENAEFARQCQEANLVFIGPSPEAIELMGDKTAARALMLEAGVPMAPGTVGAIASNEEAQSLAADIGYPVLVKAAAGGGGKGMRVVSVASDLESAIRASRSEAANAFGDDRVFIEKYLVSPKHIEVQIIADRQGNTIHLLDRDCSIQRRHQKVIEEAPSPTLSAELRERMGATAVRAAQACNYEGAGTVEFLLDAEGNFYFLEMNTRLQVEHPVTEEVTGVDLVEQQLRIASGLSLSLSQDDVRPNGCAIECRVYAEDTRDNFLPSPGRLLRHRPPSGPGIRVDTGVEEGDEVSIYYDPMIAKLIAWGATREQAIERMQLALRAYEILGVPTTLGFCDEVLRTESFKSGKHAITFVESESMRKETSSHVREVALATLFAHRKPAAHPAADSTQAKRLWKTAR